MKEQTIKKPKKVNRMKKGNDAEKLAKKDLEFLGYIVDRRCRVRFQNNDYFNMFDLIAVKKDFVSFIQIKTNVTNFYTARKQIEEWLKFNGLGICAEIWLLLFDKDGKPKEWRKVIWGDSGKGTSKGISVPFEINTNVL